MTVTIDKAGRIVVPKLLRDELRLNPGTEFTISRIGSRIELEPMSRECRLVYKDGIPVIVHDGPPIDFDVHAALMEDYERRADFISGRFGYDRDDLL